MEPLLKTQRIKDPRAVEECRQELCEVCGRRAHGQPHHIVTVGAGGPDISENLIQLCWECHYGKVPNGKLSKRQLFTIVARRLNKTFDEVIQTVEKALGRGVKL